MPPSSITRPYATSGTFWPILFSARIIMERLTPKSYYIFTVFLSHYLSTLPYSCLLICRLLALLKEVK